MALYCCHNKQLLWVHSGVSWLVSFDYYKITCLCIQPHTEATNKTGTTSNICRLYNRNINCWVETLQYRDKLTIQYTQHTQCLGGNTNWQINLPKSTTAQKYTNKITCSQEWRLPSYKSSSQVWGICCWMVTWGMNYDQILWMWWLNAENLWAIPTVWWLYRTTNDRYWFSVACDHLLVTNKYKINKQLYRLELVMCTQSSHLL